MNRRDTVLAFIALGIAPTAALAQSADKLYRVGFLAGGGTPRDGAVPARLLQVTVQPFGLREPNDFTTAFDSMTRERPDALFLVADSLTFQNRKRVADFVEQHRIPSMFEFGAWIHGGGLMAYGPSAEDSYRVVARFLDRIAKGARPSDLPVEQLTRYYLAINLKTAKAIGLTMPHALLVRADEVIQ